MEEGSARKAARPSMGLEPGEHPLAGRSALGFRLDLDSLLEEPREPATNGTPQPLPDGPTFAEIGGLDEQIRRVRELVEAPLRHPEVFQALGITPPRSVLLSGPPGCGKTLLARALARESGASFHAVAVTELLSKFVGESERSVRELFEHARASAPAIVFLDEVDAIGYDRADARHGWEVGPLTQLLAILDGFEPLTGVAVLAATNRPERLDPALTRPGRLDRHIVIPPPSRAGRRAILGVHTARMPLADDVDLEQLADATDGATGADLRALCQEAAWAALRRVLGPYERWAGSEGVALDGVRVEARDFVAGLATRAPGPPRLACSPTHRGQE